MTNKYDAPSGAPPAYPTPTPPPGAAFSPVSAMSSSPYPAAHLPTRPGLQQGPPSADYYGSPHGSYAAPYPNGQHAMGPQGGPYGPQGSYPPGAGGGYNQGPQMGYAPQGGYQQGGYPPGGYPQGGYPPGGYPPQGQYLDGRRSGGGFMEALAASMACCCCLELCCLF